VKPLTREKLVKKADALFSLYIRHRDGERRADGWWSLCITCRKWKPLKSMQAGHFRSRRYYSTRWDEENVNAQCDVCNRWNHGEQYIYAKELDLKYGEGTADKLLILSRQVIKINSSRLEEIIEYSKQQLNEYEGI
jgi:hypothetical protein